ncbi:MAG: glycosyltransferase [Chloroflexi bacterium]|nr:glycosyltransferase [Chloroflexota bacterium]
MLRQLAAPPALLGERLLDSGTITSRQLAEALQMHRATGVPVGQALVNLGFTSDVEVMQTVASQRGVPFLDLRSEPPDPRVAHLLPRDVVARLRVLPVREDVRDGTVLLACTEIPSAAQLAELERSMGRTPEPVIVAPSALDQTLHEVYRDHDLDYSGNDLASRQPENSAKRVLSRAQQAFFAILVVSIGAGLLLQPVYTGTLLAVGVTLFYVFCSAYKLYLTSLAFARKREVQVPHEEIAALDDRELPVYTVLVPLYRETEVLPVLVDAITRLDYPKPKLDVRILLEEDDVETRAAVLASDLPGYFTPVVVPKGTPKGKPRACNYGLIHARGEYVVIYDAEDLPDRDQLKKALLAFKKGDDRLACVQAKLNYFNRDQNILTRWFTSEYSMWFDLLLPGLGASGAPIPLGGTSNHFRIDQLRKLGAWDPYNVTEDADLGIRLHKAGSKTVVVDSTTYEEANSETFNWILQRSRWIKGYIQTYLVHMRNPVQLWRSIGPRAFISFQFMVGGTVASLLLNPIFWGLTALWFATRAHYIQEIFPTPILYLGTLALFFGNFAFVYLTVAGCLQRRHYHLVFFALLTPIYWALMSIAAWKGFVQLFYAPSYWEKTRHGLYRGKVSVE